MAKDKRGPGQPTKYKPEYCQTLLNHMSEGLSFESFAGLIGVKRQTLYNWVDDFPEFREAKETGTDIALLYWEKLGRDNIINESFGNNQGSKALNATTWIFTMKNRFKWRDKQPEEVPKTEINIKGLTDEQLEELYQKYKSEKEGA